MPLGFALGLQVWVNCPTVCTVLPDTVAYATTYM